MWPNPGTRDTRPSPPGQASKLQDPCPPFQLLHCLPRGPLTCRVVSVTEQGHPVPPPGNIWGPRPAEPTCLCLTCTGSRAAGHPCPSSSRGPSRGPCLPPWGPTLQSRALAPRKLPLDSLEVSSWGGGSQGSSRPLPSTSGRRTQTHCPPGEQSSRAVSPGTGVTPACRWVSVILRGPSVEGGGVCNPRQRPVAGVKVGVSHRPASLHLSLKERLLPLPHRSPLALGSRITCSLPGIRL